ncbi:MAG: SPOR domain-containing protein [Phaeospirillum sp.]|nr:SPOR domain-containing protein [Phaeospirillum sp.]
MLTRMRRVIPARGHVKALLLGVLILGGCAPAPDPMQTIRDGLFYDGLAAFHEGFHKEAAVRWERAAHFGDAEAARNLGHLYRQGLGVEQDTAIAVAWYQVAADAGVASAQYNLGMVYLNGGPNFAIDRPAGLRWLTQAAAGGIAPAQRELDRLAAGPEPKPEPKASVVSASAPAPVQVAAAAPFIEPPQPPVRIQVGSYRTRQGAEADLRRLKRPGLDFEISPLRLKDGKQWYRLIAQGKAEDVGAYCRAAASHKIGCWPHNSRE